MKRKKFITWLFNHSQEVYTSYFKSTTEWGISRDDLLNYPRSSLGYRLGAFLEQNQFELIPKVERHDVYHTLTGYGTEVEDEIALQYLCLGNGKLSLYLIGAILIGTIILPEYSRYYFNSYLKGKRANPFHNLDYPELLDVDFVVFREVIFAKEFERVSRKEPKMISQLNC